MDKVTTQEDYINRDMKNGLLLTRGYTNLNFKEYPKEEHFNRLYYVNYSAENKM